MPEAVPAPVSTPSAPAPSSSPAPSSPGRSAPPLSPSVSTKPSVGDQVKKAPEATPAPAAAPVSPRFKFKSKVRGEEIEEELSYEEVQVRLQKGHGVERKFQELSEKEKKLVQALEYLKNDPDAAAKELGVDLEAHYTKKLAAKYQAELLTPEERAEQARRNEVKSAKDEAAKYKQAIADRARNESDARLMTQTQQEFMEGLKLENLASGEDPKEAALFLRTMAQTQKLMRARGTPLTPPQLAKEVRYEIDKGRALLESRVRGGLKGSDLLKHLGAATVKEVIAARMAEIRAGTPALPVPEVVKQAPVVEESTERRLHENGRNSKFRKSLLGL